MHITLSSRFTSPRLEGQYTTIIDGMDIGIPLTGLKEVPVERTASSSGLFGRVHFLWDEASSMSMLTIYYHDLDATQARKLITIMAPRSVHERTLAFVHDPTVPAAVISGSVDVKVTAQGNGYWSVVLECAARPHLYARGST